MALDFDKLVIDKIDLISIFSKSTGELWAMLDEMKDGTLENAEEIVYGTGATGRRLSALKRNKTARFSGTNGYVVGGLIVAQTGSDVIVADSAATILTPTFDIITVGDIATSVNTTKTASGDAGNEIGWLYKLNPDATAGTKYAQGATASATEFAYNPTSDTITLPTDAFETGDKLIVFYNYMSKGKKYVNSGDTNSKTGKVVIDAVLRDVCDNSTIYHAKFVFPNASIDGNFSFAFGNEPTVHNFACEALSDPCSIESELWYLIIPENEE